MGASVIAIDAPRSRKPTRDTAGAGRRSPRRRDHVAARQRRARETRTDQRRQADDLVVVVERLAVDDEELRRALRALALAHLTAQVRR